ncbi:MAG: apolipoprotein N-acyltransferase [Actinomycetota bacterium]
MTARAYPLALASGIVLALAWPSPDVAPLAWIAIVPLLVLAQEASARRAVLLGALFGMGFFGVLLLWISIIGWVAWVLLVALQASFIAAFASAWSFIARRERLGARLVLAPLLWVAVEYLRSRAPMGGFTWGQLAQGQHGVTWLLSLAALGGGWLVSAVVVLVNASLAEAWRGFRRKDRTPAMLVGLACVALAAPALLPQGAATGRRVRVAIVQGNVPRSFEGSLFDKEVAIIRSHARLTKRLAGRDLDVVVWPESSVGLDLERTPAVAALVGSAARAVDAPLIIGGNLDLGQDRYLVMAFEISPEGGVVDRYQKTHLVPFGEYVPARSLFDWIPMLDQVPRDAVAGTRPVLFEVAGGRVAPVISFEGDFGSLVRSRIARGGRLLVVATNTSTWGTSAASAQHVAFSQVRAAENGVWVAHAALSGISAFVAPRGVIVDSTPLWRATTLIQELRFAAEVTFYARTGDWLPLAAVVVSASALAAAAVRRKDRVAS